MSLPGELLEQARRLASREPRRPRQASLRRAVSAAYYALFHLLIAEATRAVLSGTGLASLRPKLSRAFDHKEMRTVSRAFTRRPEAPRLADELAAMMDSDGATASDLTLVARTFVELQQRRHEADYDTGRHFERSAVLTDVESASQAFRAWKRIRATPVARAYLISLLVSDRWNRK